VEVPMQISSPYYPKSNGKGEATVKSMKKIICAAWNSRYLDGDKLYRALQYAVLKHSFSKRWANI